MLDETKTISNMKRNLITEDLIKDWEENYGFFFSPDYVPESDSLDPENKDDWEEINNLTGVFGDLDNAEPVLHSVGERLYYRNHDLRSNGIYISDCYARSFGWGYDFADGFFMIAVKDGEIVGHFTDKELEYIQEHLNR
jgi:hypothetical protein